MRFVVCVKQVPGTSEVRINKETGTIIREGIPSVLNPFDEFALNEALRVRQESGGEVIVISMGPPQAEEALRKCLAIGADKAILLCDRAFAGSDTWATSFTLAKTIEKIGRVDIIFCGQETTDGSTGQTGPEIARHLGLPQLTYVEEVESVENKHAVCRRETDDGYERIKSSLPVLIACLPPSNFNPIIPNVMNIIEAKKKSLLTWNKEEINGDSEQFGLAGSPTQVMRTYPPAKKVQGIIIQESTESSVGKLLEFLSVKGIVE